MEITKRIETSIVILEIKEDIIYITVKKDASIDIADIIESVEARKKLQGNKPFLALVDNRNMWQLTKQASDYSASKEVGELSIAMAVLSDSSLPKRLMANFFIRINKSYCPSKLFSSEEKALEWLNTFR
jgi:hypothetical protein